MKYFILSLLIIIFSSCSIKNYEHSDVKIITIKSPKIRFSDIGYIRHTNSSIELELFIAGQVFQKIQINKMICVKGVCMTKSGFNREYLNKNYPNDILQNIILADSIYNKKNMLKTEDGFLQVIKTKDVNIKYRVTSKESFFKDYKNHILIKIKDTK